MGTIDRRTFLATGLKAGVVFAAIGSLESADVPVRPARPHPRPPRHRVDPEYLTSLATTGECRAGRCRPGRRPLRVAGDRPAPRGAPARVPPGGHHGARLPADGVGLGRGDDGPSGVRRVRRTGPRGGHRVPVDGADRRPSRALERAQRAGRLHHRAPRAGLDRPVAAAGSGRPRRRGLHLPPDRTVAAVGHHRWATAYVAAAHRYQLWVNGSEADAGPSFCFPDEQYYQATDVTRALRAGTTNAIGVLHHWYGPGRGRPASAPGLLVQVTVHYTDGRVVTIASDADLADPAGRVARRPATQQRQRRLRRVDRRSAPPDRLVGRGLRRCRAGRRPAVLGPVGTAPFIHLYAQRTRISEHAVSPASVRTLPNGSVVVDFGKVYAGRPTVTFRHGTAGHVVPLHVGYTLDPDGSVSTTHNTQGTDLSFSYIQRVRWPELRALLVPRVPLPPDRRPGETIGKDQVALLARHAAMPACRAGDLLLVEPGARAGLGTVCPLGPLHLPGAVHRHADPGEGPVPLGRGQRVRDRHAYLRRAEPQLAGPP